MNELLPDWPIPLPGVMSALLVSMDDSTFTNNWLHGDMRQYDITDPHSPNLPVRFGWVACRKAPVVNGAEVAADRRCSNSLDGKRLYVTTSLLSTWDNQFYPVRTKGGVMVMVDCDVENRAMAINENFIVDFGEEPNGQADATRPATQVATARAISGSNGDLDHHRYQ